MTRRRAALPRAALVLIAISSLVLFGGTLLGAGSANEVAARGGCDEAAARAIYWAEGYEAQVVTGDGLNLRTGPGTRCAWLCGCPDERAGAHVSPVQ